MGPKARHGLTLDPSRQTHPVIQLWGDRIRVFMECRLSRGLLPHLLPIGSGQNARAINQVTRFDRILPALVAYAGKAGHRISGGKIP